MEAPRNGRSPQQRSQITFPELGRTKQAGKDACDINKIMHRYIRQGVIEHVNKHEPQYLDNSGLDFQAALELVAQAREIFADLPSQTRAVFKNDPAVFMDFVQNPANVEELKKGTATQEPTPVNTKTNDGDSSTSETKAEPSPA